MNQYEHSYYRFTAEQAPLDDNPNCRLRETHRRKVWEFNLPSSAPIEYVQGAYEVLIKVVGLAPKERGFELSIDTEANTITLAPFAQTPAKCTEDITLAKVAGRFRSNRYATYFPR